MKRFLIVVLALVMTAITACGPSASQIATAGAQTQAAIPTNTPTPVPPTATPLPTNTPLPTMVPPTATAAFVRPDPVTVLLANGFKKYAFTCNVPCTTYYNKGAGIFVMIYSDGSLTLDFPLANKEAQGLTADLISKLYGDEILGWCDDHLMGSLTADQFATVGNLFVDIKYLADQGMMTISFTPM